MSVRVMQAVWQHSKQSGGALVLLLAIADHARDDGGGAYPSIDSLAAKARMTGRNVNLLLKELEAAGELGIERGKGPHGCNIYSVTLPGLTPEKISPLKIFHPENPSPEKIAGGENLGSEGVKFPVGGGEISGRGGVKPTSPKPSVNRQEEPSGEPSEQRRAPRPLRVTLDTYQPAPGVREWAEAERPGIDFAAVVENWRDWHRAKGDAIKNFDASLRTWVRREPLSRATTRAPAWSGRRPTVEEANLALQRQIEAQEQGHEPDPFPEALDADWHSHEQGTHPRPLRPVVAQVRRAPR